MILFLFFSFLVVGLGKHALRMKDIKWGNASNYEIQGVLGQGHHGTAYLAKHRWSQQNVVIKTFMQETTSTEDMLREIDLAQRVTGCPHTPAVHDVISYKGEAAVVISFLNITSMNWHHLSPEMVRSHMYDLLEAVACAASRGVSHLDIQPANIRLDKESGRLRLIDWGDGRLYPEGVQDLRADWALRDSYATKAYHMIRKHFMTNQRTVSRFGSFYPPEFLLRYKRTDLLKTDVWSVGCLFGAWIFHRHPSFIPIAADYVIEIAKIFGSEALESAMHAKGVDVNLPKSYPGQPLESLVNEANQAYATPDALDLLMHLLDLDQNKRFSAQQALLHPYFDPIRNASAASRAVNGSLGDDEQAHRRRAHHLRFRHDDPAIAEV
eukprot:gene7652-8456_t